jgi:phage terminase Nu1 subunit (DNA packaging protein)
MAPSIRNYIKHLREVAAGRLASEDSGLHLVDESARLKAEQRKNYELKNAVLQGTTVKIEAIQPAWSRVVVAVRRAMLAIPSVARMQMHLSARDAERLSKIIRDALKSAAFSEDPPLIGNG